VAQGAPLVPKGFTRAGEFKGVQRFHVHSCEANFADVAEGAIMFNDPLSIEQCERLMIQLSETAFPFQCAHGRSVSARHQTRSLSTDVSPE